MNFVYKTIKTPLGQLKLVASHLGLRAILWEHEDERRLKISVCTKDAKHSVLVETERQLNDYFSGRLKQFFITLDFHGTEFQKEVWKALLSIPFGEKRSYGQIARLIGRPKASRAVGTAIGKNPISIIAPCHRVIGQDGSLTGFAGGLEAKAFLLNWESR